MTILSSDASYPSVKLITISAPFDKEKLDKEKGNWRTWRANMYSVLCLSGLWDYLTGDASEPDNNLEPMAHANWAKNDRRTCGFLFGAVSEAERKAITPLESDAKAYFDLLTVRHKSDGPVSQVYLIKEAMAIHARTGESFTKGVDQIFDLIDRAWAMDTNGVTLDTFKVIVALNYFGKDHQDIQFAIQDRLKLATTSRPFTPRDLREFIEDKQRLINANNRPDIPSSSIALATQNSKPSKDKGTCGNCGGSFHISKYCIKPGGGMEGKTIEESKSRRRVDREAEGKGGTKTQNTSTQQKIKVPYTDPSGRAFMLLPYSPLLPTIRLPLPQPNLSWVSLL